MSASKFTMVAATVLIGGAACLAPTMGRSQQAVPASGDSSLPSFEQLDKSNHGYITRSDIPKDVDGLKPLRMHFAEADTNSNGRIDKTEYQAYVARTQGSSGSGAGSSDSSHAQPMQH